MQKEGIFMFNKIKKEKTNYAKKSLDFNQGFKKNLKKTLALYQISILLVEIFSFAFFLGLIFSVNVSSVSAVKIEADGSAIYEKGDVVTDASGNKWDVKGEMISGDINDPIFKDAVVKGGALQAATALPNPANPNVIDGVDYGLGKYVNDQKLSILGRELYSCKGAVCGSLIEGVSWSFWVLGIMVLVSGLFPKQKQMVNSLGMGLMAGIMAGEFVKGLAIKALSKGNTWGRLLGKPGTEAGFASPANLGIGVGIVVGYLVFASMYKKQKTKEQTIEFKCMNWQAPIGGVDCDKCNGNPQQPCSEYRCKSLGQTCKLLNAGTGQDRCVDSSPNDVTSPGIKPWQGALTIGYKYTNVQERPPGESAPGKMTITNSDSKDGCLKAFAPFEFGIITTDTQGTQPAQCKIDFNHTKSFNDMAYYLGDNNLFVENHSQVMSFPGTNLLKTLYKEANGTIPVNNDGEYTFYIRCMDGNGNQNRDEFAVRFCIDKGEDMSAPLIEATSIPTESPILYKIDNVSLDVYTNEPSNCRWSRKDTEYNNMENQMTCNNNVWELNSEFLYTCETTLTGIKDKQDNQFYFRCEDLSERKNQMQQSYEFKLIGTQPLTILSVAPNGTIGSSTSTATVNLTIKTDNGYKNGESTCFYSPNENTGFIAMFDTGANFHQQQLDLSQGDYIYYFKCVDLGGNTAVNSTSFSTFVDTFAPAIIRAYNLESKLIIITDEESACKYSTTSCNFNIDKEGIAMLDTSSEGRTHYAEWKLDQTFYIKCSDNFGNQPDPTSCSMILRPSSLVVNNQ
jgi:hypothetical protein